MADERPQQETGDRTAGRRAAVTRRVALRAVGALGVGWGTIESVSAHTRTGWGPDTGEPPFDGVRNRLREGGEPVSVAIQLYTLRDLPDSTARLVRRVGAVGNNGGPGYDAVETNGLDGSATNEITAALDRTGVSIGSAHVGLDQLEGDAFADTVETYRELGVDTFVVGHLDPSSLDTAGNVERVAGRINDAAARLDGYDARLGVHNHDAEFATLDDGRIPLAVLDETLHDRVFFEIDAGWVLTGGYRPAAVIAEYGDRTRFVHLKDMANGEFREVGEGALDLRAVAWAARTEANVESFVYEHDEPSNPAGSAATGAGVLSLLDGSQSDPVGIADVGGPNYDGSLGPGRAGSQNRGRNRRRNGADE